MTALPAERRRALPAEASPFALAVVERGLPLPEGTAAWLVAPDLPMPAAASLDAPSPRCLVMVEHAGTRAAALRRPIAHEVARSTYLRGTRRTPNPDHAALKEAARELEKAEGTRVMATGDPGVDLVGLVAGTVLDGIDLLGRRRRADELRGAMAETPAAFEESVWEPYTFEVSTVQAERASHLRAALVDQEAGAVWFLEEPLREVRLFRVAKGRNPKDRGLIEGGASVAVAEADVEVWEEGGLRLALADLLARLAEAPRAAGEAGAASLAAAWARHPPPPADTALGAAARPGRGGMEPGAGPAGAHVAGGLVRQELLPDGTRRYRFVVTPEEASSP